MSGLTDSQLLQEIEDAFSNTSYPGDDNLVYDNTDLYADVADTKTDFLGRHWKELSIDTINRHRDDLPFFTPEAFHFYLPAFLIASISYPIALIDVLPENLISCLVPRDETEGPSAELAAVVDLLTPRQKSVVLDFIERCSRTDADLKAIRFWEALTRSL